MTAIQPARTWHVRARALVEHPRFDQAIVVLIIANAITLGLETAPAVSARFGSLFGAIDRTVLGIFVVELLVRAFVYRSRFFRDPWRAFDFMIVGIALIPASGALSTQLILDEVRAARRAIEALRGSDVKRLTREEQASS